jgi:hypothetical protein
MKRELNETYQEIFQSFSNLNIFYQNTSDLILDYLEE